MVSAVHKEHYWTCAACAATQLIGSWLVDGWLAWLVVGWLVLVGLVWCWLSILILHSLEGVEVVLIPICDIWLPGSLKSRVGVSFWKHFSRTFPRSNFPMIGFDASSRVYSTHFLVENRMSLF
jgi:hypothetical protein